MLTFFRYNIRNNTYYPLPELIINKKIIIVTKAGQSTPKDFIKAWKIERSK